MPSVKAVSYSLPTLLFELEDEGCTFLRNIGKFIPGYTGSRATQKAVLFMTTAVVITYLTRKIHLVRIIKLSC
jgi:hypothetical protein